MITLSEAFRLCEIGRESVYLQTTDSKTFRGEYYFWSDRLRELVDMKKIKVVKILPNFERHGPDFLGMKFIVSGITEEELLKLERRAITK